ncbi:hypothetical protein PENSPDRAFT_731523 [Peniophora sp. CONT]|nr:hypothetical protein PENSPDRAFT_731523 [Peniophora sp. CONT]
MAQFTPPIIHPPVVSAKERKKRDAAQPPKQRRAPNRPSKLDRLSLDVMCMIFRLLAPGDLVNLGRTNKLLRGVLLSRRSVHVWKAALASPAAFGCPSCPEDMSEPAWADLLFAEPRCTSCGSGDNATVTYWELRARLCQQCEETRLLRTSKLDGNDPSPMATRLLPTDYVLPRTLVKSKLEGLNMWDCLKYECAWKEDGLKYEKLKQERRSRHSLDVRQSMETAKDERERIAQKCVLWATQREKARLSEISNQKGERVTQIRDRLLALGYVRTDINHPSIQRHRELKGTQPVTDRVWQRVGPILCQVINQVREDRLASKRKPTQTTATVRNNQILDEQLQIEKGRRADILRVKVIGFYSSLLKRSHIAPTSASFMPGALSICMFSPAVVNILENAPELSTEVAANLDDAVSSAFPSIRQWILLRADAFRKRLPEAWPKAVNSSTPPPTTSHTFDIDVYAQIAGLDLAAYTTRCRRHHHNSRRKVPESILFGLDTLAHQCSSEPCQTLDLNISIRKDSHAAVLRILDLLGLDPATTRPSDLDRLNEPLITTCTTCIDDAEHERTRKTGINIYVGGKLRPPKPGSWEDLIARSRARKTWNPMHWRYAVLYMDPRGSKPHRCDPRSLRLLTPEEKLELEKALKGEGKPAHSESYSERFTRAWGCCHCQVQTVNTPEPEASTLQNWRPRTMLLKDARQHLSEAHGIASPVEGTDLYFDRSWEKDERLAFPTIYTETA